MGKAKVRHNRTSTKGKTFPAGRGGTKKLPIKRKTLRENASAYEITGSTIAEVKDAYNWTDDEVAEFLEDKELNTCDKCDTIDSTYDLIWLTAEDFEPKKGETVPKELYKKYDALCEDCYQKSIKKKKPSTRRAGLEAPDDITEEVFEKFG